MITAKVDVTKIDKKRLFKGAKGTYLDLVLIETPNGQYGDYMVCQSVSQEERKAGQRGAILGNAKIIGGNRAPARQDQRSSPSEGQQPPPAQKAAEDDDSVPF